MGINKWLRWAANDIRSGLNTDLWLLIAAGITTIVLSAVGVTKLTAAVSMIFAVLGLLAISLIRQRQLLTGFLTTAREGPPLYASFPPETVSPDGLRYRADSYFFIGNAMGRTLKTSAPMIDRILRSGGDISVAVLNPENEQLLHMVTATTERYGDAGRLRSEVLGTLEWLEERKDRVGGQLRIHVLNWPPKISVNHFAFMREPNVIMVQHYEFMAPSEPAPIMVFHEGEGQWYQHLTDECLRIFDAATTWSGPAAELR